MQHSHESLFPLSNKIEIGQRIQKSAREMGISLRDPINLVFVGNDSGKVAVKATDYSIEKYTVFSVLNNFHSCRSE